MKGIKIPPLLEQYIGKELKEISSDIWYQTALWYREKNIAAEIPLIPYYDVMRRILWDFNCQNCGKCCTGNFVYNLRTSGVAVYPEEIEIIADYLKVSKKAIKKKTIVIDTRRIFPTPCPLYIEGEKGCSVYAVRPKVCKLYPLTVNSEGYTCIQLYCDPAIDLYVDLMQKFSRRSVRLEG